MSVSGTPLTPDLAAQVEPLLAARRRRLGHDCLSELAYSNFLLFRDAHRYRYVDGALPHIAGITYDGERHITPLFDPADASGEALHALLADGACLYPVATTELAHFDAGTFTWDACRDDADYLYGADVFRDYAGPDLRTKRQAAGRLHATHVLSHEALTSSNVDACLDVLAGWMADKEMGSGEADEAACREALAGAGSLGLDGWLFRADGRPAGFLIAQPLVADTAAVRFAKGLDAYAGIYPAMFQAYCRQRSEVAWLNFEQDLGNPNFRRTKLSFRPTALLGKFRVRPRQQRC